MQIGNAWKSVSEDGQKKWIGIKLDDVFLTLYPQLKDLSIKMWLIPEDERKKENSPHWVLTANKKMEVNKDVNNEEVDTW